MLKMKPEHFEALKKQVTSALKIDPNMWAKYKAAGLSHKRFRWDCIWRGNVMPTRDEWFRQVYDYCNDDHIDSALKKIVGKP